jgi:hypothetical protein
MKLKTLMWWAAATILGAFAVAQFFPVKRTNPSAPSEQSIYQLEPVPPQVRHVFDTACNDCHSNQTRWPWYSHVAPVSWIVVHDVNSGREHMNLSTWGSYPAAKRDRKLEEVCEQLMNEDMPDTKYAWVHRQARISHEQRELVCSWIDTGRKPAPPH